MVDTLFLRAIAILLITNSHLDALYAVGPLSQLSAGGALGNSLFFMLSGLGLGLGGLKKGTQPFREWMRRRLSRIYPSVWIVVILLAIGFEFSWKIWDMKDYFHELFYPTLYWFISALVVFYLLLYPLLKKQCDQWLVIAFFLLFIPYLLFYFTVVDLTTFSVEGGGYFKWIYYFQIMILGVWLAGRYKKLEGKRPSGQDLIFLALTLLTYGGLKILIAMGYGAEFQCFVQWLMFPFVYYALKIAQHPWVKALYKHPVSGFFIMVLGTATLEIYLVQHHIYTLAFLGAIMFPLNILVFSIICVPLAYGIHKLSIPVQSFLRRSA